MQITWEQNPTATASRDRQELAVRERLSLPFGLDNGAKDKKFREVGTETIKTCLYE